MKIVIIIKLIKINCRNLYLLNKLKELSNEQIKLINNRICKQED
jgi:hypothetical protein